MIKNILILLFISGGSVAYASNVCQTLPGQITCGKGTVINISENGMVTMNGTTILKRTQINGMLSANDAHFESLNVNGSVHLNQCDVKQFSEIKGQFTAISTSFEKSLMVYSNSVRLTSSQIKGDLRLGHTITRKQIVYLDKNSYVKGNIIFDDGAGEVVIVGPARIEGKIIGGVRSGASEPVL